MDGSDTLKKRWIWAFSVIVLVAVGLTWGAIQFDQHSNSKKVSSVNTSHSKKIEGTSKPKKKSSSLVKDPPVHHSTLSLLAVGDVLIHDRVYNLTKTKHGYDFKPMLKAVKPYIQKADIAMVNQESMIGGEEIGLSSYPSFNSPYEVGDAIKDAGFDVVTMANNHTLDRGIPAIKNAIHYWDKLGITHTGSFLSEEDHDNIRVVERHGIKMAVLAYTYGTNGIPTPEGQDYLVNRINLPSMKKDIEQAKKVSDVLVIALHFGKEYEREPNGSQKKLVQQLADLGVDIIIGSHPHVLQPYDWVDGKSGKKTFVAYSLGNFLSGQDGHYKQIGGMLQLTINKTEQDGHSSINVTDPTFIPTYVTPHNYHVVLLKDAATYGLKVANQEYQDTMKHVGTAPN